MLVKCRYCGNQIERSTAYKIVKSGSNWYYCNEDHYFAPIKENAMRLSVIDKCTDILGRQVGYSNIQKEITALHKNYQYDLLLAYLEDNEDDLYRIMHRKNFDSIYGEVRYLMAIVKNNIQDYKVTSEANKKEDIVREYIYEGGSKYKRKQKRRPLADIEGDDDL